MTTENDFERLYHLTYRDVSAYVIAKCRNPENAKDILQNTYIAFWKRLDRGKPIPDSECAAYLKTVARHEAGRLFAEESGRNTVYDDSEEDIPDPGDSPDEMAADADTLSKLYRDIMSGDALTAKIFILVYTTGLSMPEAAEALGVPLHTVKNRISRTICALRKKYGTGNHN